MGYAQADEGPPGISICPRCGAGPSGGRFAGLASLAAGRTGIHPSRVSTRWVADPTRVAAGPP